eukprot:TRINITY_DN3607_c1_g1_i2.p1 TRINITY_DN3607_c1_g1~~TRINITY_DN3607_c1_g1_i2.p1  ORF type:complete len:164 (-),score=28.56 TRINITY_DN3607_c1_g1_i2:90-581(-)
MASRSAVFALIALVAAWMNSVTGFIGTLPTLRATGKQTSVQAEGADVGVEDWNTFEVYPNWRTMVDVTKDQTRDVVEIFFTLLGQGARCRLLVTPETTVEEILKRGRKELGFDQEWIPDSDFNCYVMEDHGEIKPGAISGPVKNHGLTDFEYEIYAVFEPSTY